MNNSDILAMIHKVLHNQKYSETGRATLTWQVISIIHNL